MNLSQLEILHLLQETGYNLTKVADKMNVVQSAVSRQLLMLEDEIGTPLFERHGKRLLGPTPGCAYSGRSNIPQSGQTQHPGISG